MCYDGLNISIGFEVFQNPMDYVKNNWKNICKNNNMDYDKKLWQFIQQKQTKYPTEN